MAATELHSEPPSHGPVNELTLSSATDSRIASVSLYNQRAEITRILKVVLLSGQNRITISGLPNSLKEDSLRVEGRGEAAIHDVTTFEEPVPARTVKISPKLQELTKRKEKLRRALARNDRTIRGLEIYLESLKIAHVKSDSLLPTIRSYNEATEECDEKKAEIEEAIHDLDNEIAKERGVLTADQQSNRRPKCLKAATINVFAVADGGAELILVYAVDYASWTAVYDIRVTTETEARKSPVELVYKATIKQDTGEDWTDIPITLQTATPTFGLELPTLWPWFLSVHRVRPPTIVQVPSQMQMPQRGAAPNIIQSRSRSSSRSRSRRRSRRSRSRSRSPPREPPSFYVPYTEVASQGRVNASFNVPGLITVPSDGIEHSVSIAKVIPEADLSWICVPSVDARVHLTTKIKNTSQYTLLSGTSSVYVDGSFIAKSRIPLVSPDESFTCPLGLDPSIKVTYHPQVKKGSKSGLITRKTSSTSFLQRITVHNTKSATIHGLKIIDHIPVSQDSQITIKLNTPSLSIPQGLGSIVEKALNSPPGVTVANGVVAQWYNENDSDSSSDSAGHLGKDGKLAWTCTIASQKTIDLSLAWEVSAPAQVDIVGL